MYQIIVDCKKNSKINNKYYLFIINRFILRKNSFNPISKYYYINIIQIKYIRTVSIRNSLSIIGQGHVSFSWKKKRFTTLRIFPIGLNFIFSNSLCNSSFKKLRSTLFKSPHISIKQIKKHSNNVNKIK